MARRRGLQAFTLIELMVVIAIAGALFAIIIPLTRGWLSDRKVAAVADELVSDLKKAATDARTSGISPSPPPTSSGGTSVTITDGAYRVSDGARDVHVLALPNIKVQLCGKMSGKLTARLTAGRAMLFEDDKQQIVGGIAFNPNGTVDPPGQILVHNGNIGYLIYVQVDLPQGASSLVPAQVIKVQRIEKDALATTTPGNL